MSFREKSAWISLLSLVVICGAYFWRAIDAGLAGHAENFLFNERLIEAVITLIIVQIVLHSVIAIRAPKDADTPMDEREKLFALKAERNASYVMSCLVFWGCLAAGMGVPHYYLGNGLFFILVAAETVRAGSQIAYYRMGA